MAKGKPSEDPLFKLAVGINAAMQKPDEKPVDLIQEQIDKNKLLIGKGPQEVVSAPGTEKPKDINLPNVEDMVPPIIIDGHKFRRTNVPTLDALTVLMYIVSEVLSEDERVADILRQVEFRFPDNDGNLIFPRKDKKTKANKSKTSC